MLQQLINVCYFVPCLAQVEAGDANTFEVLEAIAVKLPVAGP